LDLGLWDLISSHFSGKYLESGGGQSQAARMMVWPNQARAWAIVQSNVSELTLYSGNISFENLFCRDTQSNKWRSITFHTIFTAIEDPQHLEDYPTPKISKIYQDNVSRVASELDRILEEFTGRNSDQATAKSIRKIASLAGELGLQFGVHRAHLLLDFPETGSQVRGGTEYSHYRDGEKYQNQMMEVELVLSPGLVRIGDGRRSLSVKAPLQPSLIYPSKQT
jgi:hypothetical protein